MKRRRLVLSKALGSPTILYHQATLSTLGVAGVTDCLTARAILMLMPDHGRPSFQLPGQGTLRLLLQTHFCFAVLKAAGMGMGMGMMPPGQVSPNCISAPRCWLIVGLNESGADMMPTACRQP